MVGTDHVPNVNYAGIKGNSMPPLVVFTVASGEGVGVGAGVTTGVGSGVGAGVLLSVPSGVGAGVSMGITSGSPEGSTTSIYSPGVSEGGMMVIPGVGSGSVGAGVVSGISLL